MTDLQNKQLLPDSTSDRSACGLHRPNRQNVQIQREKYSKYAVSQGYREHFFLSVTAERQSYPCSLKIRGGDPGLLSQLCKARFSPSGERRIALEESVQESGWWWRGAVRSV